MKNRKFIVLGALLVSCLLSVTGCKEQETKPSTNFGQLDATEESSGANSEGIGLEESTTQETDPFAVSGDVYVNDPNLTAEENQEIKDIQKADEETQEYIYYSPEDGSAQNALDSFGYNGILKEVDAVGVDTLGMLDTREDLKTYWTAYYIYATEEEIESVLDIIYGEDAEAKKQLEEDALHTGDDWVYTEEGWKDLTKETASGNHHFEDLTNDAEIGYDPDPALDNVQIHSY